MPIELSDMTLNITRLFNSRSVVVSLLSGLRPDAFLLRFFFCCLHNFSL